MAYGKSGRQGVHRDGMHQHGFWCEDAEWDGFVAVAKRHGLSPANMVKAIGRGELAVVRGRTYGQAVRRID